MDFTPWTPHDAARLIAVPGAADDKYSRGVLGVMTGSTEYPGAAVLGVEAAIRTGVGMVRYLGPARASDLVLQRRPEVVTADGRVQAWLVGSGMDAAGRPDDATAELARVLRQGVPAVVDAGALDLVGEATGPVVITPHYGELSRLLGADRAEIAADPARYAAQAAEELGATVLLKGSRTHVAGTEGTRLVVHTATAWTATAGAGDALGGILGALLATHADEIAASPGVLPRLAATASVLHGSAAAAASGGGPFAVLDLSDALPAVIAGLLVA
jgi:hydroxyethylthiazole kinase-like uncharacterized protein yjeF